MKSLLAGILAFLDDFFHSILQFRARLTRGWVGGSRGGEGGVVGVGREVAKNSRDYLKGDVTSQMGTITPTGQGAVILVMGTIPGR